MDIFSSQLVARDSGTLETLGAVGVDLAPLTSVDALFSVLARKGLAATWAKIATYKMTEGPLALPIGDFLRGAARASGVQIVFDWCSQRRYGGITRKVIDELHLPRDGQQVRGVRYVDNPRSLFHPKLLLMGLAVPNGDELRLAIFGSANTTRGGLKTNTELGVLSAWRKSNGGTHGWPEVEQLFERWTAHAKPLDKAGLDALAEDADELNGWMEAAVPGAVYLRPYQEEAVRTLVDAWKRERYARRPTANWKGTLLVLPPATGKTLCALAAASRILKPKPVGDQDDEAPRGPIVWLSDKPLLAAQAFEEFRRTGFLRRGMLGVLAKGGQIRRSTMADQWSIDEDEDQRGHDDGLLRDWLRPRLRAEQAIVFTTKGDKKSLNALADVGAGLTIVDEAHHAIAPGWHEALVKLRSYLVIGLTATPYRKSPDADETSKLLVRFSAGSTPWLSCFPLKRQQVLSKAPGVKDRRVAYGRPVESFYETVFTGTDLAVLSLPTFTTVSLVDTNGQQVEVRPIGNHAQRIRFFEDPFSGTRDLKELVEDPRTANAALDEIDRHACKRAKTASAAKQTTVVFARTVRHAERLKDILTNTDMLLVVVHSQDGRTIEGRHRELQHVREKPGSVLVCVDMIVEGVDLPSADVLIMTRWTASERLFWQMIGRGLRGPAIGGTKHVDIITYTLAFAAFDDQKLGGVQIVDDELLKAFGRYAKRKRERLKIPAAQGRAMNQSEDGSGPQRRHGHMLTYDINRREDLGIDGHFFDVVVRRADTNTVVFECSRVKRPWEDLRRVYYDQGRKGRNYRFVVSSRPD